MVFTDSSCGFWITAVLTRTGPDVKRSNVLTRYPSSIDKCQRSPTNGTTGVQSFWKARHGALHLQSSCWNIVGRHISQDVCWRVLGGDIPSGFSNHDREFGFVIARPILGALWNINGIRVRIGHCSARLGEERWHSRNGQLGFLGSRLYFLNLRLV